MTLYKYSAFPFLLLTLTFSLQTETSIQSNLTKGRIAVLSHLAAANAFVRCVQWVGTFASSSRQTMR